MFKQIRTKGNNHQNVMEERKMGKYTQDAQQLLRLIGGKENIAAVSHCVTRMRFVLNDPSKADVEAIEAMKVVKGSFTQAGQFQVIIGNAVADFYNDFVKVAGVEGVSKDAVKQAAKKNQNVLQKVIAALAGRKVDFLFIDGDHTVGGVTADYNDYKEFVRPGGVIAFHDIVESQPLPTNQVFHFWKKLREVARVEEFVVDPKQCGFGIGIMRVPEGGAPDIH